MKKTSIVFLATLISTSTLARQNYTGPMRFSTFWPCNGNASFCGIRILAEGTIQSDTGKKFKFFLKNRKQHKYELPPKPTIVFNSPGGSVIGAIELGRAIRANGLDAELDDSYTTENDILVDNPTCTSACVIAFSGGMNRTVEPGAHMGVHQFSGSQGSIGDEATQATITLLAAYFEEMGINRAMLDRASLIPPTSIYWISNTEAARFRLDNTTSYLTPWKISADSEGNATLEVSQEISFGKSLLLQIAVAHDTGILISNTILNKAAIPYDRTSQFPESEAPRIELCIQNKCIKAQPIRPWTRMEDNTLVVFQAVSIIPIPELKEISQANQLSITDNFSRATSDVSLSTNLSSDGLSSGVALLIKQKY